MEEMDNYENQEQAGKSAMSSALYYGVIGGIALSIWSVISYMFNMQESAGWLSTALSIIIFVAVIAWATKSHRDNELNGSITFGKAFSVGFLTVLVMSVIGAIFTIIYLKFIDPGILVEAEQKMEAQMAERNMSEEEMEQALKMGKMFIQPAAMAAMGFLFNLILGSVISLITAAIFQRER